MHFWRASLCIFCVGFLRGSSGSISSSVNQGSTSWVNICSSDPALTMGIGAWGWHIWFVYARDHTSCTAPDRMYFCCSRPPINQELPHSYFQHSYFYTLPLWRLLRQSQKQINSWNFTFSVLSAKSQQSNSLEVSSFCFLLLLPSPSEG